MGYLDETKDNGWVAVRRNVLAHRAPGRMTVAEYQAHHFLLMTASSSTGETMTCAAVIATFWEMKLRHAQKALAGLTKGGYIESFGKPCQHGLYKVRVLKYEMTTGPMKGQITGRCGGAVTNTDVALTRRSGGAVGDTVDGADESSVTYSATDARRNGINVEGADGGAVTNTDVALTRRSGGAVGDTERAPIQQEHFNTDTKKEGERERGREGAARSGSFLPGRNGIEPAESSEPAPTGEGPAWTLTETFHQHLGSPAQFKGSSTAWRKKFEDLLSRESFESIEETMEWAFNIDGFWPKYLFRVYSDPLDYFLSKFPGLKSQAAGALQGRRNFEKHEQAKLQTAKPAKKFPEIGVCHATDPEEAMKKQAKKELQGATQ
jgi:hypothetical protein